MYRSASHKGDALLLLPNAGIRAAFRFAWIEGERPLNLERLLRAGIKIRKI